MEEAVKEEKTSCACHEGSCVSHNRDEGERKSHNPLSGKDSAWIVAGAVLLGSLIIAASILSLTKGGVRSAATGAPTEAANQPTEQAGPTLAKVSLDDDPVMGDRNKAKVAIVEFSDYECPFCQQFHKTTYNELIKEYVDSGKAVISFRDYPLPFHEPKASVAAETAQCVKQAKGDAAYFQFSNLYFQNTQSNGKGVVDGKMNEILRQVGVNAATVNKCAADEVFKDEIAKDMSDGQGAGVSGTPSFVIGKLDAEGMVDGELVVGALPLAEFKKAVEKYLE